jgi:hypothetical protein
MTRTVTALFDSRAEAEAARTRLASEVDVTWTRMIAKDTAAAIDDLKLDPKQAKNCHNALQRGEHLLVAKVARGEDQRRIIHALATPGAPVMPPVEPQQSYEVAPPPIAEKRVELAPADDGRVVASPPPPQAVRQAPPAAEPMREQAASAPAPAPIREQAASAPAPAPAQPAEVRDELRVGEPTAVRGGATLRSKSGQAAAEDQPLQRGPIGLENPPVGRRVSAEEVEARGLLRERVIEVVEMREEPVIEKEVVVREEVIVRKAVTERTHTVRDTVRRTQVEVEELPAGGDAKR